MAFPQVAAFSSGADTENLTERVIALPAGSGGRVFVFVSADDAPGTGAVAVEEDDWLPLLDSVSLAGGRVRGMVVYKDAPAETEITVTTSAAEACAWVAMRVTGFDAATAPAVSSPASLSGVDPDPPSLDPSWGEEDTLWIAAAFCDPGYAFPTAGPAGYEDFTEAHWNENNGASVAVATLENATESVNPGVFTAAIGPDSTAYTFAVRPGAGGAGAAFSVRSGGEWIEAIRATRIGGAWV